jgi:hypothetical protein
MRLPISGYLPSLGRLASGFSEQLGRSVGRVALAPLADALLVGSAKTSARESSPRRCGDATATLVSRCQQGLPCDLVQTVAVNGRLPKPRGRQPHVIFLPPSGHQVVLGTAGTGKTTMAMLRAEHLAAPTTPNRGPVLLVTYNNALVAYLSYLEPDTTQNLTIRTYARFARGYLKHVGLMPSWGSIADPDQRRWLVVQALASGTGGEGDCGEVPPVPVLRPGH